MEEYQELIAELSGLAGILPEYYDLRGSRQVTSAESAAAILKAMGLKISTSEEVRREIEKKKMRRWHCMLDPVTVISVHAQPHSLALHLPMPDGREQAPGITVTMEDEQGEKETITYPAGAVKADREQTIGGRRFVRLLLSLPPREIGYYTVSVACALSGTADDSDADSLRKSARLIITPDSCHMPEQLRAGRTWGVAVNLYALRSESNWGVGDLGDLRRLAAVLSGLNAGLIGINPLHAIRNAAPFDTSPYSPVTRLYRNHIYIDIGAVPDAAGVPRPAGMSEHIEALRRSERVDYQRVAAVKQEMLEQAFERFYRNHYLKQSSRGGQFREYLQAEGAPLMKHALFTALSEFLVKEHGASWQAWPEAYRSPEGPAVEAFREKNEKRILFFSYLQWLIDVQMAEASEAASGAGMPVGLYGDLAIGAVESGSDGWLYRDVLAEQVSVGAPPDDFNANGQDWGFPPMDPDKLRESGYNLFIRTIRKNMQHMGALRIDHVPGLFRLFWIPKGVHPRDGSYVRCNAEDLLRIVALESVRNRTLVIGEDLGTITDEMRSSLQRFGILSYRLFYFERNYPDPAFVSPECYPEMALAAVTTHDLPTLSGYWSARDLDLKKQMGIIRDDAQYAEQKSERERDLKLILEALRMRGLLPEACSGGPSGLPAMTPELCRAIYRYLSITPSKLVLVSLDDVIGTLDQQNLPGIVSGYPNWMQKSGLALEQIGSDRRWQELAGMFRSTRTTGGERAEAKA